MLERTTERAELRRRIEQARAGRGSFVIVRGAPGIGKTTLLEWARALAGCTGLDIVSSRGRELEREFAFGVVRQLLEDRVATAADGAERAALLAGSAGPAAALLGPVRADPHQPAQDVSFAAVHALYWVVANLAARMPALVLVDDAQWADVSSLRWLDFVAGRVGELAVCVVVAVRSGETGPVLDQLAEHPDTIVLKPAPLSAKATATIVRDGPGAHAEAGFCRSCYDATGGNPFYLGQLVAALKADAVSPVDDAAAQVRNVGPERVARLVLTRAARLGMDAVQLARAIAVLGGHADVHRAAQLARLPHSRAADLATALAQAGILTPAHPLEFVHPIVCAAVYDDSPHTKRAYLHAQAAQQLTAAHAPAEEIASHLFHSEPAGDPLPVQTLRAAAATAMRRGAPDVARMYLRRALAEPPSDRATVLCELGFAERLAGHPDAATHLRDAIDTTSDPATHARASLILAHATTSAGLLEEASDVLRAALTRGHRAPPDLALRLETFQAALGILHPRCSPALNADLPRLRELVDGGATAARQLALVVAFKLVFSGGERDDVLHLLDRGLDHGRLIAQETADGPALAFAVRALTYLDELDTADRLIADITQTPAPAVRS